MFKAVEIKRKRNKKKLLKQARLGETEFTWSEGYCIKYLYEMLNRTYGGLFTVLKLLTCMPVLLERTWYTFVYPTVCLIHYN